MQDTWNYIVIKFSATQLDPYLKASDLIVQEDSMTPSQEETSGTKICNAKPVKTNHELT